MDSLNWFKIEVCYNITGGLDSDEPLTEIEKIQLSNEGEGVEYEVGWAYFNLNQDAIKHIHPKAFVKKGNVKKTYITELILRSGRIYYANHKPEKVYELLNDYLDNLPLPPPEAN
jgi:hypothetical protein